MTLRGKRTRRGFTLIEMLTVAAIAIVLGTLIIGALFAAQEAARTTYCRNNLNQLHKLVIIYTQSYGQHLPAFWHERWIGELGLAGGQWRDDVLKQKQKWYVKDMWVWWDTFLKKGGTTFPPPSDGGSQIGRAEWDAIRARLGRIFNEKGYPVNTTPYEPGFKNIDDVNPLMPQVWNNYQQPGHYLGFTWTSESSRGSYPAGARVVFRSSAPTILCPSDTSEFRCDQGCLTSYLGLAKYGWWHRGSTNTQSRYYEYHQIQEVTEAIYAYTCLTHTDWIQQSAGKCPTCGATLQLRQVRKPGMGLLLAESEPGTFQYGGCG